MWPIWILLIIVNTGCNTTSIKNSSNEEQHFSEFNHLRVNAERAKALAESAERKVRDGWAYLDWTKANDQLSDIGSYKDNMTGKTMVARKGTTNEYYGEGSNVADYSFGCDYTFGPDKGIGYIGRHCGQSKGGLFDGWVTFEQMGRIVFLEYHNGKMNGPALTCNCQGKVCSEIGKCKDQWYSEGNLTELRQRKYPLPTLSIPQQNIKSTIATDRGREFGWIEQGKDAVRVKLKDPRSATFRKEFFHRGADNLPIACGEVNSKNSFGGYSGYQRFISAGTAELTFLEEEVLDFEVVWNRLCR